MSADAAAAILAVLKAGAAFVPVDPEQPVAVIEQILADSGAGTILRPRGRRTE
nr:AMP-binding protein [Salinispora cortesiana]